MPLGFHYREDFIRDADERVLLEAIADVSFADFEICGVVARDLSYKSSPEVTQRQSARAGPEPFERS